MDTVLVTGASGFIGRHICGHLADQYRVIGFSRTVPPSADTCVNWIRGDITNADDVRSVCRDYTPDTVIHGAAIAHQGFRSAPGAAAYDRVNHLAAVSMAREACAANPAARFIFLSSISVYGEKQGQGSQGQGSQGQGSQGQGSQGQGSQGQGSQGQGSQGKAAVGESARCLPSSPYGVSKLRAEQALKQMFDRQEIRHLDILRLAPVYDSGWALNLEKRVVMPRQLGFFRFGSGRQQLSVLARGNLAAFIRFRLAGQPTGQPKKDRYCSVMNLTDRYPVSFNQMIAVFKASGKYPGRCTLPVPLGLVRGIVRILKQMAGDRAGWVASLYDKLANDLVFDNNRMLAAGFRPEESLFSVFGVSEKDMAA